MPNDEPEYTLILRQGQTETLRIGPWTDESGNVASFTGYKIRASARNGFGASPPLWSLTSDAGEITLEDDGANVDAVIVLAWDADVTAALDKPRKTARWDCEIYDDTVSPEISDRILRGPYDLSLEVTE
jgi:hypothetical protein